MTASQENTRSARTKAQKHAERSAAAQGPAKNGPGCPVHYREGGRVSLISAVEGVASSMIDTTACG